MSNRFGNQLEQFHFRDVLSSEVSVKCQIGSLQHIGRISKQPGPNVTPNANELKCKTAIPNTSPASGACLGGLAFLSFNSIFCWFISIHR